MCREIEAEVLSPSPPAFSEIVLLEMNPHRVHAYWHVTPEALMQARRDHQAPNAPLSLWLYGLFGSTLDDDQAAVPLHGEALGGLTGQRDFESLTGGGVYRAAIGLPLSDGGVVVVASSNPVRLPFPSPSPRYECSLLDIRRGGVGAPSGGEVHPLGPGPAIVSSVPWPGSVSSVGGRGAHGDSD